MYDSHKGPREGPKYWQKSAKTVPYDGDQTTSSGSIDSPSIGGVGSHIGL